MGSEQQTGTLLVIFTSLLKVGFFVSIAWLIAQWWREVRYSDKHGWLSGVLSVSEQRHIAKRFSIFWPITLLVICIILYFVKIVFTQSHLY